jgi:hypothetical protein
MDEPEGVLFCEYRHALDLAREIAQLPLEALWPIIREYELPLFKALLEVKRVYESR